MTKAGGATTLKKNWHDNLTQVRPFVGRTLSQRRLQRIETYVSRFLRDEARLLESREQDGRVRDCHGDMRTDAVCFDSSLPGGICIYDCIEFNDVFRYGDTGLDVAFLTMDLDYRGRPDLSDLLIGLYSAAAADAELPLLLNFYKCYRACVRGKVESILANDMGVPARERTAARRRARAYFVLAEDYSRRRPTRGILLVSGPSGSGKSVLAGSVASRLGACLLATDTVRRQLFERGGRHAAVNTGIYSPDSRQQVYDEMLRQAREQIRDKRGIVLDASFTKRHEREPFVKFARQTNERLFVVECWAPDEVVKERQARREGERWSASEGRWGVYLAQKAGYEPPQEVPAAERLAVDTTLPLAEQLQRVEDCVRRTRY
jgi:predicted kinase